MSKSEFLERINNSPENPLAITPMWRIIFFYIEFPNSKAALYENTDIVYRAIPDDPVIRQTQ